MARASPKGCHKNSKSTRPGFSSDIGTVGRSCLSCFVVIEWLHSLIATSTGWCCLSVRSQRWKLYRKFIEGVGETMLMKPRAQLFKSPTSGFLSSLSSVALFIKVTHSLSWIPMLEHQTYAFLSLFYRLLRAWLWLTYSAYPPVSLRESCLSRSWCSHWRKLSSGRQSVACSRMKWYVRDCTVL